MEFRIVTLLLGKSFAKEGYTPVNPAITAPIAGDPSLTPDPSSSNAPPYNPLYDSYSTPYDPSGFLSWSPGLISISSVLLFVAELVIYIILGSLSAWLSWTSNTTVGWHPIFRVIFSIFAFIFSLTYVLSHVMFKLDLLSALHLARSVTTAVRSNAGRATQAAAATISYQAAPQALKTA